jgi:hypothetical protein
MKLIIKVTIGVLLAITTFTSCAQNNRIVDNTQKSITLEELDLLKKTLLWSTEDDKYLKMAGVVLKPQLDDVLDVWYGYVGANPHLVYYFNSNDKPSPEYLAKVRERFKQWILDVCNKPFDQEWINYQNEIGLRHTYKKGKTDHVKNTPNIVNYRYMVAFIYPITATMKPFLANGNHTQEEVDKMHNAWFKAVVLSDILWTKSYIKQGKF